MAFSRDEMAAYEKQTPAQVADDIGTAFKPAAPAAAPSAPASKPATPPAKEPADDVGETTSEDSPASEDADPAETGGEPSAETTAASATAGAQPEGETATSDEDGNQPATKGSARERIEDLVAERNALRKYIGYREELWKSGAAKPAETAQPAAAAPEASTETPDPEPNLEAMNYDLEAYNKAHKEWVGRQIDRGVKKGLQEAETKRSQTAAAQEAQTVRAGFEQRAEKFAETHSDFKAVILNPALPSLNSRAAGAMVRSEHSAAILYHLGKNPDLTARISRMNPDQQVMQIGRIEALVSAPAPASKPQKQKVSNAPPPPTTTTGGTSRGKDPTDPTMSMDEFVALDRAERQRQREQRNAARDAMRGNSRR